MSLFQCSKCGVCENTALTNAGHHQLTHLFRKETDFLADCRDRLGLAPDEPFGLYCSACTPIWYTADGHLGIGPNPHPLPGAGLWHGKFPQAFYPLGSMVTDNVGNLVPKGSHTARHFDGLNRAQRRAAARSGKLGYTEGGAA